MNHRRSIHDVAIVGAGMVGAALALALARAGFDVAMIESRAPAPWRAEDEVDLRVVALASSSVGLFAHLDVWTAIAEARACAYRRMRVWDALAPGSLSFDAADEGNAVLGYIVENRLIQSALWQAAQRNPDIALRCPARVVASEVDADRRTLVFDDDSRLAARLVVAADGAESALRGLVGIDTHDRDYVQRAIVAHVATERAHEDTAWQRFLPGATIAFLPLADGRSSIVWSLPDAEASRLLALDDGAFRAELGAAFDFRLGTITATDATRRISPAAASGRALYRAALRRARRRRARRASAGRAGRQSRPARRNGTGRGADRRARRKKGFCRRVLLCAVSSAAGAATTRSPPTPSMRSSARSPAIRCRWPHCAGLDWPPSIGSGRSSGFSHATRQVSDLRTPCAMIDLPFAED